MTDKKDMSWAKFNTDDAEFVILGTYPGKDSLEKKQFYANTTNQFWNLLGIERTPDNYEERRKKLKEMKIGLWDVLAYCDRHDGNKDTSLDKNIKDEVYNDLSGLTGKKKIFFNGQKAYKFYQRAVNKDEYEPFDETKIVVLPSSSRACAMKFKDKQKDWHKKLGIK